MLEKSPFPGMDPYLEGYIWPDVHSTLAGAIRELLAPQVAPNYVTFVVPYTVKDKSPGAEVAILYPDIGLVLHDRAEQPVAEYEPATKATKPDRIVPAEISVRIPVIEIRDRGDNSLVTAIEILSPVNKREPGWEVYLVKRKKLHAGGVHLLEIDLLRRGRRVVPDYGYPASHYLFSLWRAGKNENEIWANDVQQPLPVLPVPLKSPDPDALLPLKTALDLIYKRSLYSLSIDYAKDPPPPEFSEADKAWIREKVSVVSG